MKPKHGTGSTPVEGTNLSTVLSKFSPKYRHIKLFELEVIRPVEDGYVSTRSRIVDIRLKTEHFWGIEIPSWERRVQDYSEK